jgi:hypothetical protein
VVAVKKDADRGDPWRTRRVMELYAAGKPISYISRVVGWSEGRVRKVLRDAGIIITEPDGGDRRGQG